MGSPVKSDNNGFLIQTGDFRTHYHDEGAGPECVLFLHGSGPGVTAWANWRGIIPQMSGGFRVIAPDLLGFGYTELPDWAGRYEFLKSWTDQVASLLDALRIKRVSVVGNSFGGAVALSFATAYPDRVDRLVLMGSTGIEMPLTPALDDLWGYEPSPKAMRDVLLNFAYDPALITDDLVNLRFEASNQPGFQDAYAALFPAPRQRWLDALAVGDEALKSLPHKALLIHGRDDRIIPVDASWRMAQLIPNAQLHVIGKCGHWTMIEHPKLFSHLVQSFLRGI